MRALLVQSAQVLCVSATLFGCQAAQVSQGFAGPPECAHLSSVKHLLEDPGICCVQSRPCMISCCL